MRFEWPDGFVRVPEEDWTAQPLGELAIKYDHVERHGWYSNLDRTVSQLAGWLQDGHVVVDYSGGTGILAERLLRAVPDRGFGLVIADSSPKFLRLALEKLRAEESVAFRLIRYLKERRRLQLLDEVLGSPLVGRVDGIVSTNAIHLYHDLPETLSSWARVLAPSGRVFVQSGNIGNPKAQDGEWIIDETVEAIHRAALALIRRDARFARWRSVAEDEQRMEAHRALRQKFFLPVHPLQHYLDALAAAGFTDLEVTTASIPARVDDWYDFLSVYHEGVLGWVGGSERVEGTPPSEADVRERLHLLREAMARVFDGRDAFACCWTYVTGRKA